MPEPVEVGDVHPQRPADRALGQQPPRLAVGGVVPQVEPGAEDDAVPGAGRERAVGGGRVLRERLLAQDVLAGRGRQRDVPLVLLVARADVHVGDTGVPEQVLDRRAPPADPVPLRQVGGADRVGAAQGDRRGPPGAGERRQTEAVHMAAHAHDEPAGGRRTVAGQGQPSVYG